jgi:SagB-type dehydrogenase family enzyme
VSERVWALHRATNYLGGSAAPAASASEAEQERIGLPIRQSLRCELEAAFAQRVSCRRFSGAAISLDTLATLLDAAYGCGPEVVFEGARWPARPVPSAGARYPLELNILARAVDGLAPGSYRFIAEEHALVRSGADVSFDALADIFLKQPYLKPAAAVVVVAGDFELTTARYGDRGYRYVLFEAGHVAQNLTLAATALEMGSLSLGGFVDDTLAEVLRLRSVVAPLYGVAIGPPADHADLRQLG